MAQEIQRIEKEFIFKTLMDTAAPVALHYKQERYRGKVRTFDKQQIVIDLDSTPTSAPPKQARIKMFFRFRGTPIACTTKVSTVNGSTVIILPPDSVYRDLTRSYERVEADKSMSVAILINGERLKIDFPASESFYEPEAPDLDLNFDASRISDLLKAFREKSASFASENKITMFRERKPDSIVEHMLALSGKVIVLPFEDLGNFSLARSKYATEVLKEDDIHRMFREAGEDSMLAANELQSHLVKSKNQRIWHEMYCPVLFREYVVGYIYLMRADLYTTPFSQDHFEMVHQFSRLLSYSLKLNGYFKSEPVKETFTGSELVDISGSGLLFSYPLDGPSIQLYTDVELQVTIADRVISITGRVVRKFRDAGQIYLGVQYIDISDNDQHALLTGLYGSDYDGQIELAEE